MTKRSAVSKWLSFLLTLTIIAPSGAVAKTPSPRPSGFKFPERVGLFVRKGGVKLDEGGDPFAHYFAGSLVLATVYYYRTRGHMLEREYSDCKNEVRKYTPSARLISDSRVSVASQIGRRAIFTAQKGLLAAGSPAKSQLVIFKTGDRFLKFRITYPIAHAERADAEIEKFLQAFPWAEG